MVSLTLRWRPAGRYVDFATIGEVNFLTLRSGLVFSLFIECLSMSTVRAHVGVVINYEDV